MNRHSGLTLPGPLTSPGATIEILRRQLRQIHRIETLEELLANEKARENRSTAVKAIEARIRRKEQEAAQ